jgi:prevent-host-death family protein
MGGAARKFANFPQSLSLATAKATLSAVLDAVERKRTPITILRRGVPVAQIIPYPKSPIPRLGDSMKGTGRELGDIVSPLGIEWTVDGE